MKKSILFGLTASAAVVLMSCASVPKDSIVISKQGVFTSGGSITEPVAGNYAPEKSWQDPTRAGNTAHIDHANTFYQLPVEERGNPVVFLHGYGQSRIGWQTTPDGREGWSDIFLKNGRGVFLVDQPRRGEAGNTARMASVGGIDAWGEDGKTYMAGDQAWYTHFRIGLVAPERYEGSQFPAGDEAQNQFFRFMTVNTGDYDEKLFGQTLSEVLKDVHEKTGKKSVYITHSQGGRVGWQTDTDNIAAIVAIEPGSTPTVGSEEYNKLLKAKIPVAVYFGDYIDNGPTDIMSTGFWKRVRDTAVDFAEHYNADGGNAVVVDLPKVGITGNSHFMFEEMNNKEIADHIESWLKGLGL